MSVGQDVIGKTERRGNRMPVPPDLGSVLNEEQHRALRNIENFGWQLAFVRHPIFESPIAVVMTTGQQRYAVLEADGQLNMDPGIALRG